MLGVVGFGERECGREPAQLSGAHGVATGAVTRLPKSQRRRSPCGGDGRAAAACLCPLARRRRQLTAPRPSHLSLIYLCLHSVFT